MLHEQFPDIPRIALTATADEKTRKEIILRLRLEQARFFSVVLIVPISVTGLSRNKMPGNNN